MFLLQHFARWHGSGHLPYFCTSSINTRSLKCKGKIPRSISEGVTPHLWCHTSAKCLLDCVSRAHHTCPPRCLTGRTPWVHSDGHPTTLSQWLKNRNGHSRGTLIHALVHALIFPTPRSILKSQKLSCREVVTRLEKWEYWNLILERTIITWY